MTFGTSGNSKIDLGFHFNQMVTMASISLDFIGKSSNYLIRSVLFSQLKILNLMSATGSDDLVARMEAIVTTRIISTTAIWITSAIAYRDMSDITVKPIVSFRNTTSHSFPRKCQMPNLTKG